VTAAPVLVTHRLTLRQLVPADVAPLHQALSDPETTRWWSRPPTRSLAETRAYLLERHGPEWRWWIVTRTGEDRALGWVSAGEKRQGGVSEIGYILTPDAQGLGIGREAVTAVIDRLFTEGQRRVFADTDPENDASNRLLARLGFRHEGTLRGEWETHIGVRDSLIWGLLAAEWSLSS